MKRRQRLHANPALQRRPSANLPVLIARALFAAVLFAVAWSIMAATPPGTNSPSLEGTNSVPDLVQRMQHLEEHPLTFKLDSVPFLNDHHFLGEPLWKYVASLLYILLAFYAAKLIDIIARFWLK